MISAAYIRSAAGAIGLTALTTILSAATAAPQEQASSALEWVTLTIDMPVPAELAATGQHGTVTVEGDLSPKSRMTNMAVSQSSRSVALDKHAVAAMEGNRIDEPTGAERKIRLKLQFYSYDTLLVAGYTCGQAVLDDDWYRQTFPENSIEKGPLYLFLRSGGVLLGVKKLAFTADPTIYERAWHATIEACRNEPGAAFVKSLVGMGARQTRSGVRR